MLRNAIEIGWVIYIGGQKRTDTDVRRSPEVGHDPSGRWSSPRKASARVATEKCRNNILSGHFGQQLTDVQFIIIHVAFDPFSIGENCL